jgi:beta-glucanase (GH16 family)
LQGLASPVQQLRRLKYPGRDFLSNDYHIYACERTDKKGVWYIDNMKVFKLDKKVPTRNMYLMVTDSSTEGELPMDLNCDYVRIYRKR